MKRGKRKQPKRKKAVPAKGKKNNAGKIKKEKTDTRIPSDAPRPEQKALKELTKKQLLEKGYNSYQAELIREGFRVSKNNKVAVNDLKTGRLIWIDTKDFKKHLTEFTGKQEKKSEERKKQYSEILDIPLSRTSDNIYENVTSLDEFERLDKAGLLRDNKGRFLKKEKKEEIKRIIKQIEQGGAEFTLSDVLKAGDLKNKDVIIKAQTPKDFFYWNLQNNIKDSDFGTPKIKIIDFDGNVIYSGKSSARATSILNKLNRKMENLEKLIEKTENTRPYFTVPVKEDKIKGEHVALEIDYSGIKSRLKGDLFNKYRSML